jgi:hypothetical protein
MSDMLEMKINQFIHSPRSQIEAGFQHIYRLQKLWTAASYLENMVEVKPCQGLSLEPTVGTTFGTKFR